MKQKKKINVFYLYNNNKDSFYEKIKGYIGFGHIDFLLNEKIGSILLIPISSEWTLKL